MWFIKSPIRKQIDQYGKDTDMLLEFARNVRKPRLEEITLEDIKAFYTAIVEPKNGMWERNSYMLAVRKFFKHYRGENILRWQSVTDDPLKSVELNDMIQPMKKQIKRPQGRPIDWENVKKVMKFRAGEEKEEVPSFRQIGIALKRDPSQIYKWYKIGKKVNVDLSTP